MSEDTKPLYPFQFAGEEEKVSWGSVNYVLADLGFKDSMIENGWLGGNTLSEVMGTFFERVVGDDAFEYYGLQFPVMVKTFETTEWQPLQMNADDAVAEQRYDSLGKTALWYVLDAKPEARMALGFRKDVEPEEFYNRCKDGSVEGLLNIITPKKNEYFLIKPGTVFAAGPGLKVVEVAESSEMTFLLAGLGGKALEEDQDMLVEAFDLIDYRRYISLPAVDPALKSPEATGSGKEYAVKIAACPEFIVTRLSLKSPLHLFTDEPAGFTVYYCLNGEASLQVPAVDEKGASKMESYTIRSGHSILVPAELIDYYLAPVDMDTVLLETTVEKRQSKDSYIDENVSETLPESEDRPDPHLRTWS